MYILHIDYKLNNKHIAFKATVQNTALLCYSLDLFLEMSFLRNV